MRHFELSEEAVELFEEAKGNSDVESLSDYIIGTHNLVQLLIKNNAALSEHCKTFCKCQSHKGHKRD